MSLSQLRKYLAITRTQIINSAAYPIDLAARSLMIVMFMIIFVQLWSATYRTLGETSIAGFTLNETVWYVTIAETIVLSKSRLTSTIAQQVKDGSIAYILNKPYDFLLYHISVALGDGVVRMLFNLAAGGLTTWVMVGPQIGRAHV
jgi:ABC-2 type transport system permease protein